MIHTTPAFNVERSPDIDFGTRLIDGLAHRADAKFGFAIQQAAGHQRQARSFSSYPHQTKSGSKAAVS
jgi:hypothetical protein